MRIAVRCPDHDCYAREIVVAALVRSFSTAQVASDAASDRGGIGLWINPPDDASAAIKTLLSAGGKAVIFGRVGQAVAEAIGLSARGPMNWPRDWGQCSPDPSRHHDASPASICYTENHPLARQAPRGARPLVRFDFADEWNNLGFGRITLEGSVWSLQSVVEPAGAMPLARVRGGDGDPVVYCSLYEGAAGAALWFNRPVGPVDSLEWRVVESFLTDYRPDDLTCLPSVGEIPASQQAAACPRLDCDEAVASGRPVFELYRSHGLPISLALLTGQALADADLQLMRDVIRAGGAVVSHSVRHEPNWGGNYESALGEARESRAWIESHLPEAGSVRFAVSPFHQNPTYAVAALADCGYDGFVGGIIANDPEYLLGRAGRVPLAPRPMVSLSSQCMLHGDCYHRYGNSIDVYCRSFDEHRAAGSTFAYLDHPFSPRYQYGWKDEDERLKAHEQLIDHIQSKGSIWWPNINQSLDFLRARDAALVEIGPGGKLSVQYSPGVDRMPLSIRWKGQQFAY
jgi:hypothetical protein